MDFEPISKNIIRDKKYSNSRGIFFNKKTYLYPADMDFKFFYKKLMFNKADKISFYRSMNHLKKGEYFTISSKQKVQKLKYNIQKKQFEIVNYHHKPRWIKSLEGVQKIDNFNSDDDIKEVKKEIKEVKKEANKNKQNKYDTLEMILKKPGLNRIILKLFDIDPDIPNYKK